MKKFANSIRKTLMAATALALLHLLLFHDTVRYSQPKLVQESSLLQEDAEKWRNLLSLKNIPADVRHWFAVSRKESARLDGMEADDPALVEYIRKNRMVLPPPASQLSKLPIKDFSQAGQNSILLDIIQNKTNGFFIECGAFDGQTYSNTLYIERKMRWSGLLIEAEPSNFASALEKRRNVTLVPACLSLTDRPSLSSFSIGQGLVAKIDKQFPSFKVQCLPLYSILLALKKTTVDLFSLDIEGNELDVLKTIPYDKVDIKVLAVEYSQIKEGSLALTEFMTSKGYTAIQNYPIKRLEDNWAAFDKIFVKKGCGYKETRVALK